MEYRLLKMQLHKLPWKELYENEFPRVRRNIEMMVVEDNYDDKNYGLYSGDEKKAFSHAYSTYLKLLEYTSKTMKHQQEIEALQNVLLQDVQNYLTASACTLKNDKREIEQLMIMLGETCANQKMVDFVLKYWERERQSALEYYSEFEERKEEYSVTLDFPFVYSYIGDRVLYETGNIDLAIQFYQSLPDKARGASYERVFTLLAETAYVILIKRILLERELKQDIGYYTSLDTFRYILPERADKKAGRLSVMHVAYMNDPNEGKTFWHFIRNKKDEKMNGANRRVSNYPFVFLKCFTPVIDDLPMWEMYGNRAEGCCVILKKEWFRDKVHVPLYRVCYLRKKGNSYQFYKEDNPRIAHADELIEYLSKLHDLYRTLPGNDLSKKYFRVITEQIAFLFKDANYQHEQELRIMYWYNESSSDFEYTAVEDAKKDYPKLYVSPETYVDIQEIILGPKVRESNSKVPYLQEEFEKLSKKTGYKVPEITLSEIEYR